MKFVCTIPSVGRSTFHITEESFTQKGWKSCLKRRPAGKRGKAGQAGQFISNVRISLTVGDKVSEENCLQYVLDKLSFILFPKHDRTSVKQHNILQRSNSSRRSRKKLVINIFIVCLCVFLLNRTYPKYS